MNLHSGARSCPASRALLIDRIAQEGWRVTAAAQAAGISRRTAYKWIARHAVEGEAGLADRSSRPRHSPKRIERRRGVLRAVPAAHAHDGGADREQSRAATLDRGAGAEAPAPHHRQSHPTAPRCGLGLRARGDRRCFASRLRALHPDSAAQMGLRAAVSNLGDPRPNAATVPSLLQSGAPTR